MDNNNDTPLYSLASDSLPDNNFYSNSQNSEESVTIDTSNEQKDIDNAGPLCSSMGDTPSTTDSEQVPSVPQKSAIGDIGKRFLAYLEDSILLGLIGVLVGAVLYGLFPQMGGWEIFIGFFIAIAYFGYMNSEKCNGQTWGKMQFKVRVVDKDKKCIPLKTSIIRSVIFLFPFFVNDGLLTGLISGIPQAITIFIFGTISSILIAGLFYLILFNQKTLQVPHDLYAGTYVINTESKGIITPQPLNRKHIIVMSVISLLLFVGFFTAGGLMVAGYLSGASRNELTEVLKEEYPQYDISVSSKTIYYNGVRVDSCHFSMNGEKFPGKEGENIIDFVEKIKKRVPACGNFDVYEVQIYHGFNLGIAAYRKSREYSYEPPGKGKQGKGTTHSKQQSVINMGPINFGLPF